MLTGMSSESMDECSYLFPSLDQQIAKKSKYYIIYITACFSQHYVSISNQYLGAEKRVQQNHSSQGWCLSTTVIYSSM